MRPLHEIPVESSNQTPHLYGLIRSVGLVRAGAIPPPYIPPNTILTTALCLNRRREGGICEVGQYTAVGRALMELPDTTPSLKPHTLLGATGGLQDLLGHQSYTWNVP